MKNSRVSKNNIWTSC